LGYLEENPPFHPSFAAGRKALLEDEDDDEDEDEYERAPPGLNCLLFGKDAA